jgi:hypothetical protein
LWEATPVAKIGTFGDWSRLLWVLTDKLGIDFVGNGLCAGRWQFPERHGGRSLQFDC